MNIDHIKTIVEEGNFAWNAALNSGNVHSLVALYAEDATVSAGDGKTIVGRAAIEELFKGFIDNGVHNHSLEIIQVKGSDNMIYQVTKWSANGAETKGIKPSFGGITMSTLLHSDDDEWLIGAHVWNAAG